MGINARMFLEEGAYEVLVLGNDELIGQADVYSFNFEIFWHRCKPLA